MHLTGRAKLNSVYIFRASARTQIGFRLAGQANGKGISQVIVDFTQTSRSSSSNRVMVDLDLACTLQEENFHLNLNFAISLMANLLNLNSTYYYT